jgi:hypothetical protein
MKQVLDLILEKLPPILESLALDPIKTSPDQAASNAKVITDGIVKEVTKAIAAAPEPKKPAWQSKTILTGLALAIAPVALDYLAGVDWTAYLPPNAAIILSGLLMIGLRLITRKPVA